MEKVGVSMLNQQTSSVVGRVRDGGESILITDHGRDVAMLVPVTRTRWDRMVAAGQIQLASDSISLPTRIPAKHPSSEVLADLNSDNL